MAIDAVKYGELLMQLPAGTKINQDFNNRVCEAGDDDVKLAQLMEEAAKGLDFTKQWKEE